MRVCMLAVVPIFQHLLTHVHLFPLVFFHRDNGYPLLAPENYFDVFKRTNVTDIVRLNNVLYERSRFVNAGFVHHGVSCYCCVVVCCHTILGWFLCCLQHASAARLMSRLCLVSDLFFVDGSIPPEPILEQFLRIAETARGAIAVCMPQRPYTRVHRYCCTYIRCTLCLCTSIARRRTRQIVTHHTPQVHCVSHTTVWMFVLFPVHVWGCAR